jgi:hypothetical protein
LPGSAQHGQLSALFRERRRNVEEGLAIFEAALTAAEATFDLE